MIKCALLEEKNNNGNKVHTKKHIQQYVVNL